MAQPIRKLTLKGFKSIRSLENFDLQGVNVLIGANGSGKSNFVSFFYLLREMVGGRLAKAVNLAGGADMHLHLGPKVTERIEADMEFGVNGYQFTLQPTADNRLIFIDERIKYKGTPGFTRDVNRSIGSGHNESKLKEQIEKDSNNKPICAHIYDSISSWTVYHVHDTSENAALRRTCSVGDYERLRPDAGNLAAFLMNLKDSDGVSYKLIIEAIKLVAPFFNDFRFRPRKHKGGEYVQLEWEQQGSDYPFHPSQLSDGTIRFIALATALLQPTPPAMILIDEPELGLHPYALDVLGSLILQAEERTQLIVSTQSASLLNAFSPEHIVVIDRHEGESTFNRLDEESLDSWLADFTLGELWQKNVYGGGPAHE
jgi:predicted ATPase